MRGRKRRKGNRVFWFVRWVDVVERGEESKEGSCKKRMREGGRKERREKEESKQGRREGGMEGWRDGTDRTEHTARDWTDERCREMNKEVSCLHGQRGTRPILLPLLLFTLAVVCCGVSGVCGDGVCEV